MYVLTCHSQCQKYQNNISKKKKLITNLYIEFSHTGEARHGAQAARSVTQEQEETAAIRRGIRHDEETTQRIDGQDEWHRKGDTSKESGERTENTGK